MGVAPGSAGARGGDLGLPQGLPPQTPCAERRTHWTRKPKHHTRPHAGVLAIAKRHPEIIDVRGRGLMVGLEFGGPSGRGSAAPYGFASVGTAGFLVMVEGWGHLGPAELAACAPPAPEPTFIHACLSCVPY